MRVPFVLLFAVGSFVLAPSRASGQSPPEGLRLTESDALRLLQTTDPRVAALRAQIDEVRATQAARVIRPNPVFSFSRESVGDTHDQFVLGRQELDISGRFGTLREAGRLAVASAEAATRHQLVQLQAEVRDAFIALLLAQLREDAVRDGIQELERLVGVLRTRESEGEGSQYDRLRGERARADLDADLAAATAERTAAQGRLAMFVTGTPAMPAVAVGSLDSPPIPTDVAALVNQALVARSDLRAVHSALSQFQAERTAANRLAVPTPTFTGGLKHSATPARSESGYLFSVDLTVPLFSRGRQAAALAVAQETGATARQAALRRAIEADVRAAQAAALIHRDRAERYRRATAEISESLLKVARVGYDEGELGILELLDALRQAIDGRVKSLEFAAAARRARIELDRVVGLEIKP